MSVFSYAQLEGLWDQAGGAPSDAAVMAAIAEAESGGNSGATGADQEEGLWQIDPHFWPAQYVTYDPLGNAKGAVHVKAVQGLTAWSTYNSGAYKQYLKSGTTPATVTGATGVLPPFIPGTSIPTGSLPGGSGASILDPNTIIQDIGQTILKSFGISDFKDLFQRLGLILLGSVILFIGISTLSKSFESKLILPGGQQPPSPPSQPAAAPAAESEESTSTEVLSPAERGSAGAGAAGTGALSGEALEAAAVALWLALLSTLSAPAWSRGGLTWALTTAAPGHCTR